jgi:GTP-binding protein EngB required for normal cell division
MIEKIDQKRFLNILESSGYEYKIIFDILEGTKTDKIDKEEFNNVIQKINKEEGIKLFDMIIYLAEVFSDYNKILSLFDDKTLSMLREEVKDLYNRGDDVGSFGDMD